VQSGKIAGCAVYLDFQTHASSPFFCATHIECGKTSSTVYSYVILAALRSRYGHYIFALWFLSFYLKRAERGSLKIQDAKNRQKVAIWALSHNFVGLYLRN